MKQYGTEKQNGVGCVCFAGTKGLVSGQSV